MSYFTVSTLEFSENPNHAESTCRFSRYETNKKSCTPLRTASRESVDRPSISAYNAYALAHVAQQFFSLVAWLHPICPLVPTVWLYLFRQ